MTLSTQPYKGARDFYPEDKRLQKYMFGKLREVSERFGYQEIDAPILEPTELFLSKGNQEIIDEQTYTFTDRGGRSVTIRTEMTPTVSRMVAARRQELAYPVRWYDIPNLWRYERTQRGRLREFWQYNADIFGVEGVEADHEIVVLADQIMQSYGAKRDMYTICLSSRKMVDELFTQYLGLDNTQKDTLIRLVDRIKKLPYESFVAQADAILTPSQRDAGVLDKLLALLKVTKLQQLPADFASQPAVVRLQQLMAMLESSRVANAVFDISLMRGFDYYTDMVFEVFDTDPENNRAMFGGGRYDGLVGLFGVEPVPTVGFAMGDVTLQNFLESHELLPKLHSETDAYVVLVGDDMYEKAQPVLSELRRMGLNIAVDSTGRKLEKQIKTAVKQGIHYALFVGETELASGQFKLRNLAAGTEETHGLERIVSIAKDRRRAGDVPARAEDDEDGDLLG
ncbi:MAG TPA: histidine--tRNA ligase [Candidatus Saccharimonadales bacterium]|nr:histidine--tRNA ligase [Candidatus Saccharimonadales bacterium]